MSDQGPLVVAMTVEALVVNDATRRGQQAWMRTPMNYNAMHGGGSGAAAQSSDPNFSSPQWDDFYNGVYLKWRLPRAFRRGVQNGTTGVTTYPLVPNRWLVVRTGGDPASRAATAWIVESDYQWSGAPKPSNASEQATIYAGLYGGTVPYGLYIGRNVSLDGGTWTETGASLGLTAMAPGNPAFAAYQPQNTNVFSFVDPLGAQGAAAQTLSYTVFGWFSSSSDDPLADLQGASFAQRLLDLGWSLPAGTDSTYTASWSLLAGSVDGVGWQNDSAPNGGPPAGAAPVSIALGNTSAEALAAMVAAQGDDTDAALLEAFQLDALGILDQPDGAAELAERIQASFFKKLSGGYTWSLVAAPDVTQPQTPADHYADVVAQLNRDQAALDTAERALQALQRDLYVAWWKSFIYAPSSLGVQNPILQQSDLTELATQLTDKAQSAQSAVERLRGLVPEGGTQTALAASIAVYQRRHGIPKSLLLKRSAAPRFFLPSDPVVLLAGAGASGIVDDPATTLGRFASAEANQLVTSFTYDTTTVSASTPGLEIPLPSLTGASGVPWSADLATRLLQEAFLLDPSNATLVAAALHSTDITGIAAAMSDPAKDANCYPTGAVQKWDGNPWHPLLLMYQCAYFALPYGSTSAPNWRFDGGGYKLVVPAESVAQSGLGPSGTLLLTPTAALNMDARLTQFLANNPNLPAAQRAALVRLQTFVQTTDNWDLLSQALDGFGNILQLVQPGLYLSPSAKDTTVAAAIGAAANNPPSLGSVPAQGQTTTSLFQPWRAGQFYLTSLLLVDEWGQALWPITAQTTQTELVYLPPELTPVVTSAGGAFVVSTGPVITGLTPSVGAVGSAGLEVNVSGAGFSSASVVLWNGAALSTRYVDAANLVASVPASDLGTAGFFAMTVQSDGQTSSAVDFVATAEIAIGTLTPRLIQAGMAPTTLVPLRVTGANFAAGAVVTWNGTPLGTVFVDATTLEAQIPSTLVAAPGTVPVVVTSGGATSASVDFVIADGPAVSGVTPAAAMVGGVDTPLVVDGVGFSPFSTVQLQSSAGGTPLNLPTTYLGPTRLAAQLSAANIQTAGTFDVVESVGSSITPTLPTSVIQLPPALLQAARLAFDLVSATDDAIVVGPAQPEADPICGWLLPNHLDASLMAYGPDGGFLGELSVFVQPDGSRAVRWVGGPGTPDLTVLAAALPHFGPFLLQLSTLEVSTFGQFMTAIDETLWTTQPIGAVFDKSLAPLVGRPLAMVRAVLNLELDGPPASDPSWQFTLTAAQPAITGYRFATELGNVAQLDDGLIGFFSGDDYTRFNVVQQSGATEGAFLQPIGEDQNYLFLQFDAAAPQYVSMLVDPRAPVHATTAILPVFEVSIPSNFVESALAAMNVTFRLDGVLTDARIADSSAADGTTLILPLPSVRAGTWSWLEANGSMATMPSDATAHLSNVPPVLRQGLLQLSAAFDRKASKP